MWYSYFITVIGLITIIRLVFIMTGQMSLGDKISKAAYWIVGLILVALSWSVLHGVFGHEVGSVIKGGSPTQKTNTDYFKSSTPTNTSTPNNGSVDIIITTKPEE